MRNVLQINGLRNIKGTKVASIGIDDTLRYFDLDLKKFLSEHSIKLNRQPKAIANSGAVTVVVTVDSVVVFRDGSLVHEQTLVNIALCTLFFQNVSEI